MSISGIEQRIERMDKDIQQIKSLLIEMLGKGKPIPESQSAERIMTAKEVANFLNVDVNAIYAKCNKGEMPFFKMGKLYKFKKSEILEWVQKQESGSPFSVDDYVERYLQRKVLKG